MRDIFEKLTEDEDEDRYDPKKNLRSKIIDMFHREEFSLVDEQQAVEGLHLEFQSGDDIIKVFVES